MTLLFHEFLCYFWQDYYTASLLERATGSQPWSAISRTFRIETCRREVRLVLIPVAHATGLYPNRENDKSTFQSYMFQMKTAALRYETRTHVETKDKTMLRGTANASGLGLRTDNLTRCHA